MTGRDPVNLHNRQRPLAIEHRLGLLHADLQQNDSAQDYFCRAVALYDQVCNKHGAALVTIYSSLIDRREGRGEAALEKALAALPGLREHQDHSGEALALRGIGQLHMAVGDDEQAEVYFIQALEVARAGRSIRSEAQVLFWQGMHALKQQRYDAAERLFRQVLDLVRRVDDRFGEAQAIRGLGLCQRGQGDLDSTRSSLLEALRVLPAAIANDHRSPNSGRLIRTRRDRTLRQARHQGRVTARNIHCGKYIPYQTDD
jgi:tetratricopeptide (TPR) repeat protein